METNSNDTIKLVSMKEPKELVGSVQPLFISLVWFHCRGTNS